MGLAALVSAIPATARADLLGKLGLGNGPGDDSGSNFSSAPKFGTDASVDHRGDPADAAVLDESETCYLITRCRYYDDGVLYEEDVLEHDAAGNYVREIDYMYAEDGSDLGGSGVAIEYDQNGIPVSEQMVYALGDEMATGDSWDFEVDVDEDGRPVEVRLDAQVRSFEYDGAGHTSRRTVSFPDSRELTTLFDEDGYVLEKRIVDFHDDSAGEPRITYYRYARSDAGEVTDMFVTGTWTDEELHLTCVCDEKGNVIEVYDDQGQIIRSMEWEAFQNPPAYARATDLKWFAYTIG